MNKKYLQMLGMARRAGKLSMGHDMAMKALREHKATLLIFANGMSARVQNEFMLARDKYYPELEIVSISENLDEIYFALGYKAGIITVDDINFSNRIKQLINQEENEYGNKD